MSDRVGGALGDGLPEGSGGDGVVCEGGDGVAGGEGKSCLVEENGEEPPGGLCPRRFFLEADAGDGSEEG